MDHLSRAPSSRTGDLAASTWQKVVAGEITGLDLIVVKEDVGTQVVSYLLEHKQSFPGVEIRDEYLRSLPAGRAGGAAARPPRRDLRGAARDAALQGLRRPATWSGRTASSTPTTSGCAAATASPRIEVDAFGRPKQTDPVGGRMPEPGDTLVTTLDAEVQAAAEQALRTGIALAHSDGSTRANGGAAVVLDVNNGDILGMASYPTYDPERLGRRHQHQGLQAAHRKKTANYPLLNRAIQETKAVGSTFKAVTAVAGARGRRDQLGDHATVPRLLQLAERPRRPAAEVQLLGDRTATGRST